MNAVAIIAILQKVIGALPEESKRAIDAEIDKIEDKFKEDGFLDKGVELGMKVVRGVIKIKDYPDEILKGEAE